MKKRILVVADFHSGHDLGLTHPGWDRDTEPPVRPRLWHQRRTIWKWFAGKVATLGKIDILIANGDLIDGKGEASGGSELLYPDRDDQCKMAVAVLKHINPKKTVMSYGTSYHTGKTEDWENQIAAAVGAEKIGGEDTIDVNGLLVNYKHHVGSSSVPYSRHTAVAKDKMWNMLWAERGEYPKADILLRSHVHYFNYCGGDTWLAMTTPALQGYGTKYGGRRMSGTVDIGFVVIDVDGKGKFTWNVELLRFPMQEPLSL